MTKTLQQQLMLISRKIKELSPLLRTFSEAKTFRNYAPQEKFSSLSARLCYYFSQNQTKTNTQKMEFKAQTKKLLDIVAKSLYTDSEVFVRELLSNASDALEKQRFRDLSSSDLNVNVELIPSKSQMIFQDNGVGMSKEQLIENLGTIAKSGSKQFIQQVTQTGSSNVRDNIIGQFGVGFYSSFIVSDHVEVISRVEGSPAYLWSSDGSGEFQISEIEDETFTRGTKIIMHMRQDQSQFTEKTEIQRIIQKYSNFINFPITLNGEAINLVKPLWTRPKSEINEEDYQKFYEYLANTSEAYQYKMHFVSDVPLNLKSVLYVPKTHAEKMGMGQQKGEVSLYSKKVLIKKDCKDILIPNFLRFVKGVVDCEDIPLNISRQTFQDTALMAKIRIFISKKIIKQLKQESQKNPQEYIQWFEKFQMFIKEGSLDPQFKKDMIDLNRYQVNLETGYFNLKQIAQMKKSTQDVIFFASAPNRVAAESSPYIYPLTKAGIPVLVAPSHIEEIIFQEMGTYQGLKFANVETDTEAVERVLKGIKEQDPQKKDQNETKQQVPEDDITAFTLWMKNQLQPYVDKVVVSNKSLMGPALVISPISSSMRQMAFMRQIMEQKAKSGQPRIELRNLTLEYNKSDILISKLNTFRKSNPEEATMIVRQIFDNACIEAGLEGDTKSMLTRINQIMTKVIQTSSPKVQSIEEKTSQEPVKKEEEK